jgi:hypothetical protein
LVWRPRAGQTDATTRTTDTTTKQQPVPTSGASADAENQWLAAGFVGSNFGNNADPASTNVGGSFGYLWKNRIGAEFDLGITPNFQLQNNFFGIGEKPLVNSYMANVVGAFPIGSEKRWQPYVSGGAGAITLRSNLDGAISANTGNVFIGDESRVGGNVGGGLMGFSGHWGFKADVRDFRAAGSYNNSGTAAVTSGPGDTGGSTSSPAPPPPTGSGPIYATNGTKMSAAPGTPTPSAATTNSADLALSGLHYWRGNVGLAIRW